MSAPVHEAHAAVVHTSHLLRYIPLLPLIGATINFLLGRRIQATFGRFGVAAIATAMPLISFLLVMASFFTLRGYPETERLLVDYVAPWIHIGSLEANIAFQFDPLTAVMTIVVTGIGSLIHIYSYGYMDEEPAAWRFFALLNLFMFAMLMLVLGDNLMMMFVGWEGVGLCSWALIGFWFSETANAQAGNKAFIVNRIGDFGFLLGLFLLFWTLDAHGHASVEFRTIAEHAHYLEGETLWGVGVATLITLFFFVGATGKSAQLPLYIWLPDAMAGPTPVSALIHAATMVTAGVYMIARLSFLYEMAPFTGEVVAVIGATTAVFAATIGLAQNDIKKVLAYSTVSQLGYMFMAMGVGAYAAGVFHLMTHAFFKACLFLGSGSVIHAMHHEQDMRKMGGLRKYMPVTFWTFLIATVALAGVPGTAGFFSKDEILWKAYLHHPGLWAAGAVGAFLTAFYMFRLVFMTFYGECRADPHTREHLHESSGWMTWPLIILAGGSLTVGLLGVPPALFGTNLFEQWLAPVVGHIGHHAAHSHEEILLERFYMVVSVGIASSGILLAYLMYNRRILKPEWFSQMGGGVLHKVIYNKYYVDEILYGTFLRGTLVLSQALAWFDRTIVDGIVNGAATVTRVVSWINGRIDFHVVDGLVNATANAFHVLGGVVRRVQTGSVNTYLYGIVVVVTAVLFASTW